MASLKQQFDELFGKLNPGTVFGIDIGAHSIKVCELSGSPGKFKIEKFSTFTLSEATLIEDEFQKPSEIIEGIIEACNKANIKSKIACVGLFGPNTMTKRLSVPEGSREEIEDHIMWEAEQYITFGVDDSQISFHIIGENEGGGKDALVAAAQMELIETFSKTLSECKITLKVVDLNVLALSNVFEEAYRKNIDEYAQGALLIDYGAQSTKIIVYKNGGPIFTKELLIGSSLITEEIQRQMGVSYEEAEDLKTSVDDNGNLPEEILNILNSHLDNHLSEIRKNINFYVTHGSAEKVDYCFVSGGGSLVPGFIEKLEAVSGLSVERLNLMNAFKMNAKGNFSEEEFSAIAATVVGLAMRKVN